MEWSIDPLLLASSTSSVAIPAQHVSTFVIRTDRTHVSLGSATILDRRETKHGSREAYISYSGEDKRLDAWISEVDVGVELVNGVEAGPSSGPGAVLGTMKRKRKAVVIVRSLVVECGVS